jgi:hypothetical protein
MMAAAARGGDQKSEAREGGQETCHFEQSSLERGEVKGAVGYEFRKSIQEQLFWLKFWKIRAGGTPDGGEKSGCTGQFGQDGSPRAGHFAAIAKKPLKTLAKGTDGLLCFSKPHY